MIPLILHLGALGLVKFSIIAGIRRLVARQLPAFTESLFAAWLIFQTALIACFLTLSAFSALRPAAVHFMLLTAVAVLVVRPGPRALLLSVTQPVRNWVAAYDRSPVLIFLAIAGLLTTALAAHGLLFYDTTDDALNFLLPRVALWYQQQSVLARVPPHLFEVFAWEWNSDFNVLFYLLATGRDQACSFSNVESWLVLLLGLVCFGRALGGHAFLLWPVALFVSTMPALLYLGMTIKSELAALAGLLVGLGWTSLALRDHFAIRYHIAALAALGFASGCKVSCLPLAGLVITLLLYRLVRNPSGRSWHWIAAGLLVGLLNCRHLVNFWQYGRLLDRVSNQPRGLSADNLADNLHGILSHLFVRGLEVSNYFALFAGSGLVAIVALTVAGGNGYALASCWRRWRERVPDRLTVALGSCLTCSFLFFAGSLPWFSWSFRYYLPWLLPLFLLPFIAAFRERPPPAPSTIFSLSAGLCFFGVLQLFAVMRPSEITPGPSLVVAFAQAVRAPELDRKLGRHTELQEVFRRNLTLSETPSQPLRVLILGGEFSIYFPLFGENASNHVDFVGSPADLARAAATGKYDLVVLTEPGPASANDHTTLSDLGYHPTGRAQNMLFFRRTPSPRAPTPDSP